MVRGFTLIEALFVAAVLAVVSFFGLRAIRETRMQKAREDCAGLLAACRTYRALCGEWPAAGEQEDIIALLLSPDSRGLEYPPPMLDTLTESEVDESGRFVDPWGSPYVIEFPEEGVFVYSMTVGPDMSHCESDSCLGFSTSPALRKERPWRAVSRY